MSSADLAGETQIGNGSIYSASFMNLADEDALFALLSLSEGEFALDPSFVPTSRAIHQTTEQLLLEGMRRIDESNLGEQPTCDFSTRISASFATRTRTKSDASAPGGPCAR